MRNVAMGLLLMLCTASFVWAQTPGEKIVAEARDILHACKESNYTHRTDIDESKGRYDCDCSALVGYILKQVSVEHYDSLITRPHHRALAVSFYTTFVSDPTTRPSTGRWQSISRVMDAQPGDVLAWRKVELKPGDTTGHVMIISSRPVAERPRLVRVKVIDSTTAPHANDTRHQGQTGVGQGTIWIDVDSAGKPIGYHSHSPAKKPMTVPLSIGRALADATTQPAL